MLRLGPDAASNSPATTGEIAQLSARGQKLFFSGTVDVNASGSSTAEGSLALGFGPGLKQLAGHASDSGGGFVTEDAVRGMQELGFADDGTLVANCMLHVLNLLLSSPWPKYFGAGKIESSNALQALHSVFDLQSLFRIGDDAEFGGLWEDAGCSMPPPADPLYTSQPAGGRRPDMTRSGGEGCESCTMSC